jgi:hypothetical protein
MRLRPARTLSLCAWGFALPLLLQAAALNARVGSPATERGSADPRDLHRCKLKAVQTTDNDIRLEDDRRSKPRPAEIPGPVARRILDHVSAAAKNQFTPKEWTHAGQKCGDIFSPVFRLVAPAGLQLYVAPRFFPLENSVDYFFMYDPRTGAVTNSPPLIFTKWWQATTRKDPLKKYPIVQIRPARDRLPPLLIVEERTHNGNVYDAAVYRYFEIGNDMSLKQVLAVEERAVQLSDRHEYTIRKAIFLAPNRVRLDVSSGRSARNGARGTVLLERRGMGEPFRVVRRVPARGSDAQGLVTYCDSSKSDDDFLLHGCDFYY